MRWSVVWGLIVLFGCAPAEPQRAPGPGEAQPAATQKSEINDLNDLEEYSGQYLSLEGIFDIYDRPRGKHGVLTLDSGLRIFLPHLEHVKKGEDWSQFAGKRIQVSGRLHTFVKNPIDGMNGPYLDEISPFSIVSR